MQMLVEELEPIVTATETARSTPIMAERGSVRKEEDPRIVRRLDRVANLCAARLRFIDRSQFLLGRAVSRLVRVYDRERGLTALAKSITKAYGKTVSRQCLGQALLVFESYTQEELENRFSRLTNTHLLKAAQAFPIAEERSVRNEFLDRAVKDHVSVADLATNIKIHKASFESRDDPTADASLKEARGYVIGDGATELKCLANRSAAFLRLRSQAPPVKAIGSAKQALSSDGILIVELHDLEAYCDFIASIKSAANLKCIHTLIVGSSSTPRHTSHNLPVADRFRIVVIAGRNGFRYSGSQEECIDNPMSDIVAEELIYSLIPAKGLVVDLGNGSVRTAIWAKANDREFLAVEPDKDVHSSGLTDLETHLSTQVASRPSPSAKLDSWPMVTESQRERGSIDGRARDDLTCCERTQLAVVFSASGALDCPDCGKRCTAKPGARS